MTSILEHIQCLEAYLERGGARLTRTALPDAVHGRVFNDVITLRAGLRPAQELAALIHELAHWLVHGGDPRPRLHCTVFEYEAEAVEALVMKRLDPQCPGIEAGAFRWINPTDNLLPASVARVRWASTRICAALGLEAPPASEAQSPVDLETAAGEEVIFEYEHYGMGDFLGLPEAL